MSVSRRVDLQRSCARMNGTSSNTECVQRAPSTPDTTPLLSQTRTPTLTAIRNLTPGMKNWRIIAKVRRIVKGPYEGKDGGPDGQYMYMTLLDDQVSETKLVSA